MGKMRIGMFIFLKNMNEILMMVTDVLHQVIDPDTACLKQFLRCI